MYLVRERRHFWKSRPSRRLLVSTTGDVLTVSRLAAQGILMAPIALPLNAMLVAATGLHMLVLNPVKVAVFRRLGL